MRARPGESAWTLVVFTVLAQAAAGMAVVNATAPGRVGTLTALALLGVGGLAAAFHLGRSGRGRFALSNLGSSWLSREILFAGAFGTALVVATLLPTKPIPGIVAAILGVLFVGSISMVYLVRTVPSWNTWMTPASFFLTAAALGAAFSSATLHVSWHGLGLIHLAAVAAAAQAVLGVVHKLSHGAGPALGPVAAQGVFVAVGIAVILGLTRRTEEVAVLLFLAAELCGRSAFYDSHRRVGL